jgi:hypothetical protein
MSALNPGDAGVGVGFDYQTAKASPALLFVVGAGIAGLSFLAFPRQIRGGGAPLGAAVVGG